MKKQFQSLTEKGRWLLATLTFLFTLGIGQMWADLTAHIPGVYEKATNKGGYGCTLTTVASGTNAGTFEVYYFSAQSKYSENTTVYNEGTKQQYRLMCADGDSEYQLINRNGTGTFTASCDWIEMAYGVTGFSKSDYTFGSNKFNEFFEITPNGGNTDITKTCYIKPKEGDVLTLKVSGYVEFAILGSDNGSSKYMTVAVDGGTPTSWKSNTLSRRSVTLTTGEHTIVVANVGTSANAFYGFSLKLPSCAAGAPGNISKGTLSAGVLTLNAAGSAASGDTWYWQSSATGTDKTNSGSSFDVSAAGTYYIRSYNTADDCWSNAKSITISATDLVANYTVKYMDGTTEVGTEVVEVGEHPTGSEIADPTKVCYTFAGWSPALNTVTGTDGQVVNVNATWTPNYFTTSVDFEEGGTDAVSGIASKNIVASNAGSYDGGKASENWAYKGWKIKSNGATVKVLVQANKKLTFKFGYLAATAHVAISGDATNYSVTGASKVEDDPLKFTTYSWTKNYDALYTFTTGSGDAAVIKALTVQDTYTATRVDGKSDGAGSDANVLETTLPTPTAVSGWTFTGWTANADVKAGEDTKTAGTVLAAGTYTLLANTTFTAQWAEASSTYDITYVSAHGTAPAADNAASVVLAELSETGWAHKGWTANVDVTVDAATVEAGTLIANGKTVVLASNVTFTAVWKEIFTVTFNSKGGSAVDPIDVEDGASIAAAPADPTKDDYIFLGWSETDGGDVVADITAITISDDKTFYAKWKLDVQVSEIVFSNSFKGWIVGSTVTVFYMAGESAPTIASYAGKNLKAEGGVVISGDKIIATGTDDSEVEFDLSMTEVTPLATTGAQTFDGSEGYVKTRHAWTSDKKWKMSKYGTDGRVARGETSLYIFLGAAESVTLDWGAQKVTDDVAVYVNGTFVKNIGKNNNSAIELSNGNNMVALYSLQTSGDIWLNGLTVAPWVPVTAVTLKEGEDEISAKEIWASTSFTLTAEVTPDNASNKTITWTSSNDAVATVVNGVVTGVAANATPVTITASTVDGVTATCAVTVTAAPEPSADPVITTQPQSANYYEGASIAALEVVATGESLTYQWYLGSDAIDGATAATYQPTVSAIGTYVYHCVVTNTETGNLPTSLASDDATITISEDPAAIKLLDGSTVNHTNFITGVTADETVEFMGNTVNYAKFAGTVSSVSGVKDLTRVIAYNATTNKTKIKISAHNNSTSARSILVKGLVEGADAAVDLATIALGNKEDKISDWIEFDNAANRTIYIFVGSSAGDVYFTQVKVIESGETTLKRAGEAGYSLNFNKGRFFGVKDLTAHFEGMDVEVKSSDCQPLNTSVVKLASSSMSFDVAAPVTLTVTTNNSNTYYVTKGAAGTDNETAKTGASDFDLTAGTWYITGGSSNVEIKSIAFAAPKCAEPVIDNEPVSNTNVTVGDNLTATVVAHATDGADLAYQWYDADDNEVAGATEATLTTTTPGTYYVVVTASKAGYDDRTAQSQNATLAYRDNTIATLSALSYGGTAITLEADKYEYRVDLPEGTTDVPALAATATQASYGATAVPTDAAEFISYEAISTVLVTAEDGTTTQTYTVHFYVDHLYTALVPVTGNTTWNWTGASTEDNVVINDVDNKGLIIANYLDGANFEKIEGKANERAYRNQNGGCYQGTQLHFNTTVPGKVKFYFRAPSGGENCTITVKNNGKEMVAGTRGNSFGWSKEIVVKGDVVIEMVNDKEGGGDTRVQQIVFTELTPDYTRNVSNNIGTLCVDHNVVVGGAMGATFYQIASRNELYNDKIDFEEVLPNEELKAGEPYIFQSTTGKIELFYGETVADEPVAVHGMIGNYAASTLAINEDNQHTILYIAENKLWSCENIVGSTLKLNPNRAYINMELVPTYAEYQEAQTSNPAPRRRVTLGKNAEQVVTGVENLNASEQPVKLLINGQIFILRGEKMFDATGRLVK